jgi:hypothetical protein
VTTYIIAYLLLCPLRTVTPGPRHATPVPPMLVLFRLGSAYLRLSPPPYWR